MGVIYLNFNDFSETLMIKLSWVWLPGLAFALAGLTIARHSMKKAIVSMVAATAAFWFFYASIWPAL
jgi:hypothetical protein